jgi:hypothetical protein
MMNCGRLWDDAAPDRQGGHRNRRENAKGRNRERRQRSDPRNQYHRDRVMRVSFSSISPSDMEDLEKNRIRYQFSLRGLLLVVVTLSVSFGLLRHAATSYQSSGGFRFAPLSIDVLMAAFYGAMLLGGAIGAPIGHVFDDERGGMALFGAWLGTMAAIAVLFVGMVAYCTR